MSLWEMSVSGGVLVLAIAAARVLTARKLPRAAFALLWEVAAVRLLLPVRFRIPLLPAAAPVSGSPETAVWAAGQAAGETVLSEAAEVLPSAGTAGPDWTAVLPVLWLLGAAAAAGCFVCLYVRSMRKFRTSLPVDAPSVRAWLAAQSLRRPLEVRQSDRIAAPLTYGVLRPVILLPKGVEAWEEGTLVRVLTHELVHVRRFDGAAKVLLAAALCVHWFNPLVWALYVLANRDLELACDEGVLRILGGEERTAYALTLISLEEQQSADLSFCSHFSRNVMEERIEAIMKYKKKTLWAATLAVVLVLGSITAFAAVVPKEQEDTKAGLLEGEVLARGGEDGERFYSVDGGATWLSEEDYHAKYGAWGEDWQVEWWTAEEYEKWLEQEKKDLQEIIGSRGWTPSTGWFTWDQKRVDEAVALYEEILEEIKGGALYSRRVLDKDGHELENVALGSGRPLDEVMITTTEGHTDLASDGGDVFVMDPPEDAAELLKELERYGVTGSEKSVLRYKGQPVRMVVDGAAIEDGYTVRYLYRNDTGTVDLHTLWERKDNGDGSYDPMGALTGVAAKGDPGFDQGLIDSCRTAGSIEAVTTADSVEPDRPGDNQPVTQEAEASTAMGSETDEGTPLPEMFDKYKPFGLEYRETRTADGVRRNLFYEGKPVNQFVDNKPDGGVFTFGSSDQTPEGLTVYTMHGSEGSLQGLVTSVNLSEEEAAKPIERKTLVNGDFPKNSKGETYGNGHMSYWLGRDPDLVAAVGTEGQDGYLRNSDIIGPVFETAEEQLAWAASHPPRGPHNIPLYDFEGNEIGEYRVSGSMKLPEGISLEEAKKLVAAGGSGE